MNARFGNRLGSFVATALVILGPAVAQDAPIGADGRDDDDIRTRVAPLEDYLPSVDEIDPTNHVYGIPLGMSEDDFIKQCGKPDGYLRMRNRKTGMIYGRQHMFLFREHKLVGVRITDSILDWQVAEQLHRSARFDDRKWELRNGIREGTPIADVERIVGAKLISDRYSSSSRWYDAHETRITFSVTRVSAGGREGPWTDTVGGITIERR